jgi:hypothetical protein
VYAFHGEWAILLRAPFGAVEKPLFRLMLCDPRRSVTCAAFSLQSGFVGFAVTSPQVALRKKSHSPFTPIINCPRVLMCDRG